MSGMTLRRIKSVDARSGYRLAVAWDRGQTSIVDLSDMISKGGVFKDLADKSSFAAVRVGENNRVVEWPSPKDDMGYPIIEIDADALFEKYSRQQTENIASTIKKLMDNMKNFAKSHVPAGKS